MDNKMTSLAQKLWSTYQNKEAGALKRLKTIHHRAQELHEKVTAERALHAHLNPKI